MDAQSVLYSRFPSQQKRDGNTVVQKNSLYENWLLFQSATINQKKVIFLFAEKIYSVFTVCYNILSSISLEYEFIIILWSGNGMRSHAELSFTTSGSAGEPRWKNEATGLLPG